jgi:hypothetical protein
MMDILKQLDEAVNAAFAEFKKEFGQDVKLEDGDEFVTVFNNAALVISLEDNTLKTKFIGGKPYQVDMTLAIYEGEGEENE